MTEGINLLGEPEISSVRLEPHPPSETEKIFPLVRANILESRFFLSSSGDKPPIATEFHQTLPRASATQKPSIRSFVP